MRPRWRLSRSADTRCLNGVCPYRDDLISGLSGPKDLQMVTPATRGMSLGLALVTACAVAQGRRTEPASKPARICRPFSKAVDDGQCSVAVCADDYGCNIRGSDTTTRLLHPADGGSSRKETVFLNIDSDLSLGATFTACGGEIVLCPSSVLEGDGGLTGSTTGQLDRQEGAIPLRALPVHDSLLRP